MMYILIFNCFFSFLIPIFDGYVDFSFMKHTLILNNINSLKLVTRVYDNLYKIKKLMNNEQSMKGNYAYLVKNQCIPLSRCIRPINYC